MAGEAGLELRLSGGGIGGARYGPTQIGRSEREDGKNSSKKQTYFL
jgi:hypothetical protein